MDQRTKTFFKVLSTDGVSKQNIVCWFHRPLFYMGILPNLYNKLLCHCQRVFSPLLVPFLLLWTKCQLVSHRMCIFRLQNLRTYIPYQLCDVTKHHTTTQVFMDQIRPIILEIVTSISSSLKCRVSKFYLLLKRWFIILNYERSILVF